MSEKKEKIIERNRGVQQRFYSALAGPDGKSALKYLKSRNILPETISEFGLGWCSLNDQNVYLRGRLTVPLNNINGETLGFAGRIPTFKKDKNIYSMYNGEIIQHSQEETQEDGTKTDRVIKNKLVWWHEPIPKRNYLYGIEKTWEYILEENCAVVVEGEFDLYACYQSGIKNVVALLGSAFTIFQLRLLLNFCENIVMLLDADNGGQQGWNRTIEMYNKVKNRTYSCFNLERMVLPEGYDPFEYVNEFGGNYLFDTYKKVSVNFKEQIPI